jgi:hypothetical protein
LKATELVDNNDIVVDDNDETFRDTRGGLVAARLRIWLHGQQDNPTIVVGDGHGWWESAIGPGRARELDLGYLVWRGSSSGLCVGDTVGDELRRESVTS